MQVIEEKKPCRKIKAKPHDPAGSRMCPHCKHRARVDIHNNCECCLNHIPNKKQFTELKTFDKIVKCHYESILAWMANPCEPDLNFGWPVRIGIINYFVPVRYLAEFVELPNLEGENKEKLFLENVKRECSVLGRYMHAIK